jgi:hypothetical protein
MTGLEQRYRALLRVLPADYRAAWEEEMVASFLESTQTGDAEEDEIRADYGRPSWSEMASVLVLAVRLRTGAADGSPRFLALGRAVRLFILANLLVHAANGLVNIGFRLWLARRLPFLPAPSAAWPTPADIPSDFWYRILSVGSLAWLVAYGAVVLGRWRVARWVAVLAVAPMVVSVVRQALTYGSDSIAPTTWYLLACDLLVLAALATYRQDSPRVRALPWLLALPVAVGLVLTGWLPPAMDYPPVLDFAGLCCLAYLGTAAWYATRRAQAGSDWAYALALLSPVVLGLRVVLTVTYLSIPLATSGMVVALGVAQAVAVALTGLALARRTTGAIRDLPVIQASPGIS